VAAALGVSIAAGTMLSLTIETLPDEVAEIVEGGASLLAVGVLTFMVFWMRAQGATLGAEIDSKATQAAALGSGWALGLLAFAAVSREGLETVLFLFASSGTTARSATVVGGLAGLALAALLGYALYRGSLSLNIGAFFRVTGALIIFLAAGMLAYGIHELQEAGLIPIVVEHLWDMNPVLDEGAGMGAFLKALVGYNGNPSLLEVLAYWTYLGAVGWLFLKPPHAAATIGDRRAATGLAR
jgi:high-affinity iron transporter